MYSCFYICTIVSVFLYLFSFIAILVAISWYLYPCISILVSVFFYRYSRSYILVSVSLYQYSCICIIVSLYSVLWRLFLKGSRLCFPRNNSWSFIYSFIFYLFIYVSWFREVLTWILDLRISSYLLNSFLNCLIAQIHQWFMSCILYHRSSWYLPNLQFILELHN